MSDTIFVKQPRKDKYTVLDNTCIKDSRLSWKAKGVHTYLMSLPDDWKIYLSEVVKHSTDGKDALNSAIKELIHFGYIQKKGQNRDSGKFGGNCYLIYEMPVDSIPDGDRCGFIDAVKSSTIKSSTENPPLLNTNKLNTNIQNTKLTNYESQPVSESVFVNNIKQLFGGDYPFDKNFESDVMKKLESYQLVEKLESYLKYVFERTESQNPSKSFEGMYRILALSTSVLRDFKIIQQNQTKSEPKVCERKIVYVTCPSCGKEFDEFDYYCPECNLKLDDIKNHNEDEIKIHKALHQLSEEERAKIDEVMDARTKAKGRSFLTIEERKQFYRDLGIL